MGEIKAEVRSTWPAAVRWILERWSSGLPIRTISAISDADRKLLTASTSGSCRTIDTAMLEGAAACAAPAGAGRWV